jgi:hypothetical protein
MREFRKTERKSFFKKIIIFLLGFLNNTEQSNFGGHYDRMDKRRRKTKFDK